MLLSEPIIYFYFSSGWGSTAIAYCLPALPLPPTTTVCSMITCDWLQNQHKARMGKEYPTIQII